MTNALSRNIKYMSTDSQVCFHGWLFASPIQLHWYITGMWSHWGALIRIGGVLNFCQCPSVLTYPVDCVHLCHLLRAQHHCLCPNGRENLPLACSPTPLYTTPVTLQGLQKTIAKTSSKCCVAEFAMKH